MRRTRMFSTAAALAAGLLLASCGGGDDGGENSSPEEPPAETQSPPEDMEEPSDDAGENESETQSPDSESTADSDDACFIHLFDGDNFDDTDDNFKLTEPGKYETLADLPGADRDWTDEADSLKVGDSATVTIYSEENFEGTSQDLDPGSEHADVDDEPRSLEMSCD